MWSVGVGKLVTGLAQQRMLDLVEQLVERRNRQRQIITQTPQRGTNEPHEAGSPPIPPSRSMSCGVAPVNSATRDAVVPSRTRIASPIARWISSRRAAR